MKIIEKIKSDPNINDKIDFCLELCVMFFAVIACIVCLFFLNRDYKITSELINAKLDTLEEVQEQVTLNKINKALLNNNINVVFEKE